MRSLSWILGYIAYEPIVRLKIGPLSLSPHGIGIAVGFYLGSRLMLPAAVKRGIREDDVYSMLIRAIFGAILGARFFYVVNHLGDFTSPLDWLKLWQGGFTFLGGLTGAILVNVPSFRKKGYGFFEVMDAAVPGIALGLIVGRIGDLAIADHLGKETTFFLGYRCPAVAEVGQTVGSPCAPGTVVHSTALYDLMSVSALLLVLLLLRRKQRYTGFLTLFFAVWYGIGRMVEDFLRVDKTILGLTGSQWAALTAVLYGLYILVIKRDSPNWGMGRPRPLPEDAGEDEEPGGAEEPGEGGEVVDAEAGVAENGGECGDAGDTGDTTGAEPEAREPAEAESGAGEPESGERGGSG